jgi:Zn-dependent peptidase ImmA (M78 family)/transcriptional regulator with XRE-family HTH domain
MKKLNPQILRLGREARGFTQEEFAERLGIDQGRLSKVEKGILSADDAMSGKVAEVLDFPLAFFYQERRVLPVEGHYRRKISTSVKRMKENIAKMTLAEWHLLAMLDEMELPKTQLPAWDLTFDGGPELCARHTRDFWKIPKGRLSNLTKWIEDHGVVIIDLDLDDMDGFSAYVNGNIPAIFINRNFPPDRYRLTLAHELAHLILHFGKKVDADRDLEAEAYAFAIEFLVPESNIRPFLTKLTIEKLADLKSYWHVSMQALLKYANSLGMVTGNQYRYLWMQMGSLGYRKHEPVTIPSDSPALVREMIDAYLSELDYSKEELAQVLFINVPELESMYLPSKGKLKIIRKS